MNIKLYYAKSVDGKKTLQFRGKTLIVNDPFLFEHVVKLTNDKLEKPIVDMKDYQIFEIEIEGTVNEKK